MSDQTRNVLETIAHVLFWCWILGIALQILTFVAAMSMTPILHSLYGDLFGLSPHESDLSIAAYMALQKYGALLFFFIPWLSIKLVLRKTGK